MTAQENRKIDWAPILVVIIGSFMAFLNSSIVNVAIPKMMVVFGASQDSIQWILTGYMLALGVVMPLSGYLGDTFGYKRVFIAAMVIFLLGSSICGLAWNIHSLVAARVIQALGGGIMQPLGMALIYRIVPREKIGMVLGVWGISAMAAPAIGPTLGGYLVEYASWRTIFYINVPIGIINLFLALTNLKETELIKGKTIDKWGMILSSAGFFTLLMALSKGNSKGWTSPFIMVSLFIAITSLIMFVAVELNHPEPILELRLFNNFVFTLSLIISSILSIGLFGAIFLVPIFLQNVLGLSAMQSGLITLPAAVVSGIMMPISGRVFDKYGARMVTIAGLIIITITTFMMHSFDPVTPIAIIVFYLTIRGAGMGLANMPVATAGMNTVPMHLVGKASALSNVIRQVSASFGIAIFTTIVQHREIFHMARLAETVSSDKVRVFASQSAFQSIAVSNGLNSNTIQTITMGILARKIALIAAAQAIGDCFIFASALCLLALVLCGFLKEGRAPRRS